MLSTEITNIPISISILRDREYNNLSIIYKLLNKTNKRRAFSEKSTINTCLKCQVKRKTKYS